MTGFRELILLVFELLFSAVEKEGLMKPEFHLIFATNLIALAAMVACGPQNVPQPQRFGPGVAPINPMFAQQQRAMMLNQNRPIPTNMPPTATPRVPVPKTDAPAPLPPADSADVARNFEFARRIESAHLIPLPSREFRVLVQLEEFSSPIGATLSLDKNNIGKISADGLSLELKEAKSSLKLRRLFLLTISNGDKKEKAEVQFEVSMAEMSFRNSEIFENKKGSEAAQEFSEKIKALVDSKSATATIGYWWVLSPKAGINTTNTLSSGVDFVLTDKEKALIALSHTHVSERAPSGDNISFLTENGGELLGRSTSILLKERTKSSKISGSVLGLSVSFEEQSVNVGFQEMEKSTVRHVAPRITASK